MAVRVTLNTAEFKSELRGKVFAGITRATVFLHEQCRLVVNVPNTGVRVKVGDIHTQAAEQLKGRDAGLIKFKGVRKFKENGQRMSEPFVADYFYNKKTLTNRKTATVYPYPSKPGEPPRKRTGWGQRHIVYDLDETRLEGRVGIQSNALYMLFLELGTRRIKPRPWLVATLNRLLDALRQLVLAEAA